MTDLFEPIVPPSRQDERFQVLAESRGYAPARAAMREVFDRMGERDPNFIEQFQTGGFDARVFELYLFAAFDAADLDPKLEHAAPDFLLEGHGFEWSVEATTANPSGGGSPPALPENREGLEAYISGESVVRLGSALFSKLGKRYWEMPHVRQKPFVLAIQSFAAEDSQQLTDTALIGYLFGLKTFGTVGSDGHLEVWNEEVADHVGSKAIPSHFFGLPDADHISAVLWSNSGTTAKFARMGCQEGSDTEGIEMIRHGLRYDMDPNATLPSSFAYRVGSRFEPWEEGLVMAHNPRANFPLPFDAFPGIVHHYLGPTGLIEASMPPFHALRSRTHILVSR